MALGAASLVLSMAGFFFSKKAAEATNIDQSRESFNKEITSDFQTIENQTKSLVDLQVILEQLESRITSILSDYTALLNQISIVSTLMLGVATATFGALLGNTEDQPAWKVNMYVISCVFTVCFSIISVIESFFLSIHIYAEESKFTAGLYPHQLTGTRSFQVDMLKGLSKSYSGSIVTFFVSFLFFSVNILGVVYIGLGKSMYVLGKDDRLYTLNSDRFINTTTATVSEIEPEYTTIAFTMTIVVGLTYLAIIWLFVTTYRKYILWPRRLLECCGMDKESLKEPMRITAEEFQRLQGALHAEWVVWEYTFNQFLYKYEKIYDKKRWEGRDLQREPSDDETGWNYIDVEYEIYIFNAYREQLKIQRKTLVQLRMLQVSDKEKRIELNLDGMSAMEIESKHEGKHEGTKQEFKYQRVSNRILF